MKRILCVGRKVAGGWELAHAGTHPLPPAARAQLVALWPPLTGPELTPAECEQWFERHFTPHPVTSSSQEG